MNVLLTSLRELYSRLPETYHLKAWEIQRVPSSYRNVTNVVNAVNETDALLTTTPPDADKPRRAAAAWVARDDWPQLLGRPPTA
jgi:hypothetical protein